LLFIVVSIFMYTNIVASQQSLLTTAAIFRIVLKEQSIEFSKPVYEERSCVYEGRRVCEKIAIGRSATPATSQLVGFVSSEGKIYNWTECPDLKKDEFLVIAGRLKSDTYTFNMIKARDHRICGCIWGSESISLVEGKVEIELEKIKEGSNK
jgi:hypothetical protein